MLKYKIENSDIDKLSDFIQFFKSALSYEKYFKTVLENFVKIVDAKSGFIIILDKKKKFKIEECFGLNESYAKSILADMSTYIQLVFLNANIKIVEETEFVKEKGKILIPLLADNTVYAVIFINNFSVKNYSKSKLGIVELSSMVASMILSKILINKNLKEKIQLKDILIDLSNSLEKVFSLKDAFDLVMKKLADSFNIIRGMLVLFEKNNYSELSVFSAFNITESEISRGIYKVGEGIIGKVVESGKPISIKDINKDKRFLNRMKIKRDKTREISFTAVPIKISGIVFGVLAIEKYFEDNDKLTDDGDLLFLISGIIADKVKIFQKLSREKNELITENLILKKELYEKYGTDNIVGKNKKMVEIFEVIKMVADSDSSIMIHGASGTGKELVAKALHYNSSRKEESFISINCAAIPENLLEAELFGYKKGAFTGASTDRKGKFLLADRGTLFLDEIGDMPLYLQAKLLRALQEREIEPIGSEIKIKIDIRIVSATNKDPSYLIKSGKLREDLYYRLNVVGIKLPELKERKDDIPLLIQHFIEKYSVKNKRSIKRVSEDALRLFLDYHWPGNVRELENVVERAILLSKDNNIEVRDLPDFIIQSEKFQDEGLFIDKWIDNFIKTEKSSGSVYSKYMNVIEKDFLLKAFLKNERNKVKTALYLGINRNTLRSKMNEYGIKI